VALLTSLCSLSESAWCCCRPLQVWGPISLLTRLQGGDPSKEDAEGRQIPIISDC
jgi:hypothetical protein